MAKFFRRCRHPHSHKPPRVYFIMKATPSSKSCRLPKYTKGENPKEAGHGKRLCSTTPSRWTEYLEASTEDNKLKEEARHTK